MNCIRCNIFGHKMRPVKNIGSGEKTMMCIRCGYHKDTRMEEWYDIVYSLQARLTNLEYCLKQEDNDDIDEIDGE